MKGLLEKVVKTLIHQHHYKVINRFKDAVGVFGYLMKDAYGNRFYLIAKGSRLFRGLVSCQAFLPHRARDEKTAIILAWKNPEDTQETVDYFLFDPEQIIESNEGMNVRRDVQFINWKLDLGKRFYPTMDAAMALAKLREQAKLERF